MKAEPFLCFAGIEVANANRTLTYLRRNLIDDIRYSVILRDPIIAEGGYDDVYCLAPHHKLLTADLNWVACGDISLGDELLAFEENPKPGNRNRRFRFTKVTKSKRARKHCVRVHISNGDTIECSVDHPWLGISNHNDKLHWIKSKHLLGRKVQKRFSVWEPDYTYEAGWLAGIYDGEGCLVNNLRLGIVQLPGIVCERIVEHLTRLKVDTTVVQRGDGMCNDVIILGGIQEALRVLGTIRPIRLLQNFAKSNIEDRSVCLNRINGIDYVTHVEDIGIQEVQSIATSSGTYIGEGYLMHNSDEYSVDFFSPRNLSCFCAAFNEEPYVSPAADDADWYESTRPESVDFLGVWLHAINLQPVISRGVVSRSREGAVVGPLRLRQRVVECEGIMFAKTAQGMAWGERWLADVLSGSYCDADFCSSDEAVILPACPDDSLDADSFFRTLKQVGIVDGPLFTPISDGVPECKSQKVNFQLAAGLPWLYGPSELVLEESLSHGNPTASVMVSTEDWVGDASTIITVTRPPSGSSGLRRVTIEAHVAIGGECPVTTGLNPCFKTDVIIQRGDSLIIDSAARRVLRLDGTTKRYEGGLGDLDFDGLFKWLDVPPCTRICITFTRQTGFTGSVAVELLPREL